MKTRTAPRRATRHPRARPLSLALALALTGCGYKGDLVAPEHRDEKAGQVEPDPVEPAATAPERDAPRPDPPGTSPPG